MIDLCRVVRIVRAEDAPAAAELVGGAAASRAQLPGLVGAVAAVRVRVADPHQRHATSVRTHELLTFFFC